MNEQNPVELWRHLHWLTVLAQQGSYTAAATRLGVSKAAMSQHMAELERAAGVPLVRRWCAEPRAACSSLKQANGWWMTPNRSLSTLPSDFQP